MNRIQFTLAPFAGESELRQLFKQIKTQTGHAATSARIIRDPFGKPTDVIIGLPTADTQGIQNAHKVVTENYGVATVFLFPITDSQDFEGFNDGDTVVSLGQKGFKQFSNGGSGSTFKATATNPLADTLSGVLERAQGTATYFVSYGSFSSSALSADYGLNFAVCDMSGKIKVEQQNPAPEYYTRTIYVFSTNWSLRSTNLGGSNGNWHFIGQGGIDVDTGVGPYALLDWKLRLDVLTMQANLWIGGTPKYSGPIGLVTESLDSASLAIDNTEQFSTSTLWTPSKVWLDDWELNVYQ